LANNRAITGIEAAIEKHVTAIIPNSKWDTLYIYYWLCTVDMQNYIKNPSYPSININEIKAIPIPKPPDLAIQHRIVSRLEASLSMLNASRQTLDQMIQDAQFVMKSALKEVIEQLDRRSPYSPSLGRLIANRTLIRIGGGTPSEDDRTGSFPWVKSQDMKKWYISDSQEHISSHALGKRSIKLVPAGSVLVTRRSEVLAHSIPIAITTKAVTINQDMTALQITGNLIPEYLGYILRAREEQLLRQITSSPQKGLPLKALESVVIPDISLDLQKKIVTYLETIQEQMNTIDEILKQDKLIFDQVEKSLLERAFRGDI
jgi:type I restriction enzyme S subunit